MTDFFRSRRRYALLALVAGMHMLALFCWPRRLPADAGAARAAVDVVFIEPARVVAPLDDVVAPRMVLPPRPRPRLPAPAPAMVLVPQAPASLPAPVVVQDRLPEPAATDLLRASALASVGKIDKELRKASLTMSERTLSYQAGGLERGIGAAHVHRGPAKVEELVMADGRRISRIGNKCAYMESNALTRGRDVIKEGVRTVWADCDYAR